MLKSMKKPEVTLLNIKVTAAQRKAIEEKAKRFTRGNVSAWLRYAGSRLTPPKKDVAA